MSVFGPLNKNEVSSALMFYLQRALCYRVSVLCIHFQWHWQKINIFIIKQSGKLNMFKLVPDVGTTALNMIILLTSTSACMSCTVFLPAAVESS